MVAKDQSHQDKLLPGEAASMSSGNSGDAMHWVRVYAELVGFKDRLLDQLTEQGKKVSDEGRAEVEDDQQLLRPESERLHRRLAFWRQELERRGG